MTALRSAALANAGVGGHLISAGELVASKSCRGVDGSEYRAETAADFRKEVVARGVAEGVVDDLEVIDVQEEDGHEDLWLPGHAVAARCGFVTTTAAEFGKGHQTVLLETPFAPCSLARRDSH